MAAVEGSLYVFGGKNTTSFLGDLYSWDSATRKWTALSRTEVSGDSPTSRAYHAFSAHNDLLFVFGGWGYSGQREREKEKERKRVYSFFKNQITTIAVRNSFLKFMNAKVYKFLDHPRPFDTCTLQFCCELQNDVDRV